MRYSEQVYGRVLADISAGRWQPGEIVSAYGLAAELAVSRTPVIEALKRLESEGLIEVIPKVGCRIIHPSPDAVAELVAMRGALEGLAAEAAATRIESHALDAADAVLDELDTAAQAGDRPRYAELEQRFYAIVLEASGLARATAAAQTVWTQLRALLATMPLSALQLQALAAQHRAVAGALRGKAPARARAAAERHAANLAIALRGALEREGDRGGLVHQALLYSSAEEFLCTAVPYLLEGIHRDERLLAVTSPVNARLLQSALGPDADRVEFVDAAAWYLEPTQALHTYQRYVERYRADGRVRIIGEPVWAGRDEEHVRTWRRYEAVLNVAFALFPASILCPYDAASLPGSIVRDAHCTHPEICTADGVAASADYVSLLAPGAFF